MTRALAFALLLALGACDGAFDPLVEGGPAAAVYGALDGRAAQQALRVQVLGAPVFGAPADGLATVSSTELTSGRTTAWRPTTVATPSGDTARVFVADLAVTMGEAHRVEVTRTSDGAVSTVTVRLPDPTAAVGPLGPGLAVTVSIDGLPGRVPEASVRYVVRRADGTAEAAFEVPVALDRTGDAATFPVLLGEVERRAQVELYPGTKGDVVFVEGRLELVASSTRAAPVEDGVGGVGWVVPLSVALPFGAEVLRAVGFVVE